LRHLLSILLLPFTVTVLIPYWLISRYGVGDPAPWVAGGGLLLATMGLALLGWCVWLFARVGGGTLAPWDPTTNLVAAGPYAYVRNPMISGVLMILLGEAVYFDSSALRWWAIIFLAVNHAYFVFIEEPGLEKRFGQAYRDYKTRVPCWLPRLSK
jgi:protein-S-isoprenylcysteine O-methyltransferase Ste14